MADYNSSENSNSFINDYEKMQDFRELSKVEFLTSYSYLTEEEYEATAKDVSSRLAEFMPFPSESIFNQMESYGVPKTLEDYSMALKGALADPYTFGNDVAAECRARDLLKAIDKNTPFDYSRIQFQDEIMYDTDISNGGNNPKATVDMEMWLTDRQYKDLLDKIDFSQTELGGYEEQLKSGVGIDLTNLTVNAYAVLSAEGNRLFKSDTSLEDINANISISIMADISQNGNVETKNYVCEIPLYGTDKYNLISVMENYSQSKLERSLEDLMSEAKESCLSSLGNDYIQGHHIDGMALAHDLADFSYDYDPYAAQDNTSLTGNDPKTDYIDEFVAAFQSDPTAMTAAFFEFYDEEVQASFSDEQRDKFSMLVSKVQSYNADSYRGFEYTNYISSGISEQEQTEYLFQCPDTVLQEYANRIPTFKSISGSKDINVICKEDDVELNVIALKTSEGSYSIALQKNGWEYGTENINIPLSDAEKEQINSLIMSLEQEKEQPDPQKTWTNVMKEALELAGAEVLKTVDVLSRTQLSLPQLDNMLNGTLDLSDETVMYEPLSDFRDVTEINAIRQLVENYPLCIVDSTYIGNEEYNHLIGFATADPIQIIELLDSRLTEQVEGVLKQEIKQNLPHVDLNSVETLQDYIELGNLLKEGTSEEKAFFYAHKTSFDMCDLVENHIQDVDMSEVVIKLGGDYDDKDSTKTPKSDINKKHDDFER